MTTGDNPETGPGLSVPAAAADAVSRYAAFISYSHVDEAAAKSLHRRLETYRLPSRVRAAKGGTRIGTIFRDRADLAAASDLSDSIKAALADSAALIVLCSPEAKASRWVDAEVRLFRELHPAAPILAVVLRGEPAEALPPSLVEGGREPLAADFRKDGDGPKLGFLKVVAALKALALDSLIQRDAQRRLRRVIGVTVAAVTLMIAMAGMTAYAISAQREAQRQRAEAEGLVEFMLTDLRTRLRGVGRIDVMSAVNDRAMGYYDSQGDLARLSDDSLERRARVLQAMGEDQNRRGNKARARQLFYQAFGSTETLLDRAPSNPDRIFAHAQSEYWMATTAVTARDAAANRAHLERYAMLAARLDAVDPDRARAQREIGYAQGNLCTLAIRTRVPRYDAARRHCAAALTAQQRVLAMQPDDPQAIIDVINRLSWIGELQSRTRRPESAMASMDQALALARRLVARDTGNADWQDMLFAVLLTRGNHLIDNRQPSRGQADLAEARQIIAALRAVDPHNERWQRLAADPRLARR